MTDHTYPTLTKSARAALLEATSRIPYARIFQCSDEGVAAGAPRYRVDVHEHGSFFFGEDLAPTVGTHAPHHVVHHASAGGSSHVAHTLNDAIALSHENASGAVGQKAARATYRPIHDGYRWLIAFAPVASPTAEREYYQPARPAKAQS